MYASKYVHKSISVSVGTFEASIFDSKSSLIRRQSSILTLYVYQRVFVNNKTRDLCYLYDYIMQLRSMNIEPEKRTAQ